MKTKNEWYQKNKKHALEYASKYREENRDAVLQRRRELYNLNKEVIKKHRKENYYKYSVSRKLYIKKWILENREYYLERRKKYNSKKNTRQMERNRKLKQNYNITLDEYNLMVEAQQNRCLICNTMPLNKKLYVDHNHTTGRIRGLLCHHCNSGLGYFKDNTKFLQKAIEYLNKE